MNPFDIGKLKQFIVKYMRKYELIYTYTKDKQIVKVGTCFEDAITDSKNILYLIPNWELDNGNNSNSNSGNGNGSNENDSEVLLSISKILKLS